jgi:hypothetical protein
MDTHTQVPQRVFVDLLEELSATSSMGASERCGCSTFGNKRPAVDGDLPEDCIRTMIQMGGDVTT